MLALLKVSFQSYFSLTHFDFIGIHDGVAAKLRKKYGISYLELNTCVAHSYALVGKHAGQYIDGK